MTLVERDSSETFLGTVVGGKYRLERFAAEGGMGSVYHALDVGNERYVAVKLLKGQDDRQPEALFGVKVRQANSEGVGHVHVVLDFGRAQTAADGVIPPFIVTEWVEGPTLEAIRMSGPQPWDRALNLVWQACLAVEATHEAGIVHGDIKPSNLIARRPSGSATQQTKDFVVLVDFGIARSIQGQDEGDRIKWCTPGYSAPEVMTRGAVLGPSTDVYGLGVVLFELLSGRQRHAGSKAERLESTLKTDTPELDAVPRELNAIVRKATARDPRDRYRTAGELAAALRALAENAAQPTLPRPPATEPITEPAFADAMGATPSSLPLDLFRGDNRARRSGAVSWSGVGPRRTRLLLFLASTVSLVGVLWELRKGDQRLVTATAPMGLAVGTRNANVSLSAAHDEPSSAPLAAESRAVVEGLGSSAVLETRRTTHRSKGGGAVALAHAPAGSARPFMPIASAESPSPSAAAGDASPLPDSRRHVYEERLDRGEATDAQASAAQSTRIYGNRK